MPEVRIKLDKAIFFKFILLNNFLRNLALNQWEPYMVTPVGIRVNSCISAALLKKRVRKSISAIATTFSSPPLFKGIMLWCQYCIAYPHFGKRLWVWTRKNLPSGWATGRDLHQWNKAVSQKTIRTQLRLAEVWIWGPQLHICNFFFSPLPQ